MSRSGRQIARSVRASGTSFYWAMRLLPRPRRHAMFAIYAFCRELDDIADGSGSTADKLAGLMAWRHRVRATWAGRPEGILAEALHEAVNRFRLETNEFEEIILGMEMDVRGEMTAPTLDTLRLYCRRVAGAVGLLSIRVFGCTGSSARAFALALGEALQLTNILRDLDEDAGLSRLYLPSEFLDESGITVRDPRDVLSHPALPAACERLARLAEERFDEAGRSIDPADGARLRPALAMMTVYFRLLGRLRRRGWQRRTAPRLGVLESLWVAFRHMALPR